MFVLCVDDINSYNFKANTSQSETQNYKSYKLKNIWKADLVSTNNKYVTNEKVFFRLKMAF